MIYLGIVVRVVLSLVALFYGRKLLVSANSQQARWRAVEEGVSRAEAFWERKTTAPFDLDNADVPANVAPYLGPKGPRTELCKPKPANAEFVWGWVLFAIAALLAVSVVAQAASGLF